jgi:hypothetical protein
MRHSAHSRSNWALFPHFLTATEQSQAINLLTPCRVFFLPLEAISLKVFLWQSSLKVKTIFFLNKLSQLPKISLKANVFNLWAALCPYTGKTHRISN